MEIPEKNLKMIMFNTQICDLLNFSLINKPKEQRETFEWILNELLESESK